MAQTERLRFDFSQEALDELERLQEQLNASSRAEVVRDALGVLKWATHHLAEGDTIMIKRPSGETAETDFSFLRERISG